MHNVKLALSVVGVGRLGMSGGTAEGSVDNYATLHSCQGIAVAV